MNNRRLDALERRFSAAAEGCPRCRPIPFYDVRRGPDGAMVQLDGSPLPPPCDCAHGGIKFIEVVHPDAGQVAATGMTD
jgi:hypothetical protein